MKGESSNARLRSGPRPEQLLAPLPWGFSLAGEAHGASLAGVCFEPQLLSLLPNLILVPAQEARRGRERVAVIEGVPEVFEVHFGPGLARVCVHRSSPVLPAA